MKRLYEQYREEDHAAWSALYAAMEPVWEQYAHRRFRSGLAQLGLSRDRIPRLSEVDRVTFPATGFRAQPVNGYLPSAFFFDSLRRREFPTAISMRPEAQIHGPAETDVFHDLAGHAPMNVDPVFTAFLERLGHFVHTAAVRAMANPDPEGMRRQLVGPLKAISRFTWYTLEVGLTREGDGLKAYGGALLSSAGELRRCLESAEVQRQSFRLDRVINQPYNPLASPSILFILPSLGRLSAHLGRLEEWLQAGRLDSVSPGDPEVSEEEIAVLAAIPGKKSPSAIPVKKSPSAIPVKKSPSATP